MATLLEPDFDAKRYGVWQDGHWLAILSWCCGAKIIEADPDNLKDSDMFCVGCEQRFSGPPSGDAFHWLPTTRIGNPRSLENWVRGWVGEDVEVSIG